MQALDCIEFARHGADMFLVSRVDAVAPLARLLIQILPAAELATHQKVPFDKPERPFDPCLSDWRRRAHAPQSGIRNARQTLPFPERESFPAPCRAAPPRACCRSSRAPPRPPCSATRR